VTAGEAAGSNGPNRSGRTSLLRLGAAALVVGLGLLALWQAGVLFRDGGDVTASAPGGATVSLRPADTSVPTPASAGLPVGLREGDVAPDFEFSAFDGRRMRLSELRGRAVLLNFWAVSCFSCRQELPDMETLLRANPDRLAVLAVNAREAYEPANRYLRKIEVQLTAFAYDPLGDVVRLYGVYYGLPTSYFIDSAGVVRRVVTGQMSLKLMQSLLAGTLADTSDN